MAASSYTPISSLALTKEDYPFLSQNFTEAQLVEMGTSKSGKAINYLVQLTGSALDRPPTIMLTQNKNSGFLWLLPSREETQWGAKVCKPDNFEGLGISGKNLSGCYIEAYKAAATLADAILSGK